MLGWLVVAARHAETVLLWDAAPWQWRVPLVAMPVAMFLFVAGLLAPNPLSISVRSESEPGAITAVTRHPVVWAFLIWALAHIPPNGDLVSVILSGVIALFSAGGFLLLDAKARKRLGPEPWRALSADTSILPFAAILSGRARRTAVLPLILTGAAAVALYGWFILQGHSLLIGPDPLAGLARAE